MSRKMIHSGVEWIGEIPEGWSTARMKSGIAQRDGGAWGDDATGTDGDCICLRIADFDYSRFSFKDVNQDELTVRHYNDNTLARLKLEKGHILIEKSGGGEKTPVGRTVIFDKEYPALFANFMDRLICSDIVLPMYMQYILATFYKNEYSRNYIKQTTGIQNLDLTSMLAKEQIPLPSLAEQERIVLLLNEKCIEINNVLDKSKASIEEYKKLKQAIITEVTLQGIRKTKKKKTNLDWLDVLPENWSIKSFKYILNERNEKNNPAQTDERLSLSIDLGVTLYSEKTTNLDRFKEDVTQYKLAYEGDLVLNSMNMIVGAVGVSKYFGCVSPAYYTFYDETLDHCTSRYCDYFFRSIVARRVLRSLGKGIMSIDRGDDRINTCRLKISREDLKMLKIPVPPLEEQREIIEYLDEKCKAIDELIKKKEIFIEEMETYKKSLIYEYTTGKREA